MMHTGRTTRGQHGHLANLRPVRCPDLRHPPPSSLRPAYSLLPDARIDSPSLKYARSGRARAFPPHLEERSPPPLPRMLTARSPVDDDNDNDNPVGYDQMTIDDDDEQLSDDLMPVLDGFIGAVSRNFDPSAS
ncbi:uncharacterized protein BJ171DRAFT_479034 [Polychytrium aggregatum]|uniref:uncharacterized protein n=1 Tax=Polychytrium aggregatum TaxID=110093 RepID=UPI0022FF3494|nr:uncharacterized protein BJ171DRAFT_479034 [Polychytrium aggregatum]KAI9193447.1 hypothetical protein BJ171DRAFT_479034 [Polychytrium aggregatum]